MFPEGGFLCKRRETSQKYAKKNNLPILENVSLPRVGAMQIIFNTLGPVQDNKVQHDHLNNRASNVFRLNLYYFFDTCTFMYIFISTWQHIKEKKKEFHEFFMQAWHQLKSPGFLI